MEKTEEAEKVPLIGQKSAKAMKSLRFLSQGGQAAGVRHFGIVSWVCDRNAAKNPLFSLDRNDRSGIFLPLTEGPRSGVGDG
jgi:hypothetical protein